VADRTLRPALGAVVFGACDFGFFTIAGPAVDAELELRGAYAWVFGASAFAFAGALLPSGSAVSRRGGGRVQRWGSSAVIAGLVACASAGSAGTLLAGRVLMGLGGAAIAAAAWAALAAARSSRGFAASGGAVALGFTAGVLTGGLAASLLGWRAAVLLLIVPLVPALRAPSPARGRRREVPGLPGIARFAGAVTLLAGGLASLALLPPAGGALLAAGAVLWRSAARSASRAGWLPPRPAPALTGLIAGAVTASGVGATVLLGRALAQSGGHDPVTVAAVLCPFGLAVIPATRLAAGLLRRRGAAVCATVGLALQAVALGGMALAGLDLALTLLVVVLFGCGHVLANAGAAELALASAGAHGGALGAMLAAAQYVGSGVGALVVLGIAGDASHVPAVQRGLAAAAAIAGAGALLAGAAARAHARLDSQRVRALA
jgi:MFS family permease